MTLDIRSFQTADAEILRNILIDSFEAVSIDQNIERRLGPAGHHDWRWRKGRHFDDDLNRESSELFVAVVNGTIAGYVSTWIDQEASVGFIPNLAVHPAHRSQGIGRKLLQHALHYFREQGLSLARIETLEQNPVGQHLYPSVGFTEVARQIHYSMRLDT